MSKSFKLTSGIKLNVGKKSVSTTIGKRGLSTNIGSNGTFINIGIPGTGIRYRRKLLKKCKKAIKTTNTTKHYNTSKDIVVEGTVILGLVIGGAIFLISGSWLCSIIPVFLIPTLYHLTDKTNSNNK